MLPRVTLRLLCVALGASWTQPAEQPTGNTAAPPLSGAKASVGASTVAPREAAATALIHLRVAISGITAIMAPVWIGVDEGLYRKYGLEVEFANFDGGTRAVTPVVTGDTPIGSVTSGAVIDARLQGADVRMYAALFDTFYAQIFSRPEVRAPQDMRGRTMA